MNFRQKNAPFTRFFFLLNYAKCKNGFAFLLCMSVLLVCDSPQRGHTGVLVRLSFRSGGGAVLLSVAVRRIIGNRSANER